jgi:hypothetical protein
MYTKQSWRESIASRKYVGAEFNRWWLLPFGILNVSALIAASIIIFGPSFIGPSLVDTGSSTLMDCSGARANDYSCYQERYQQLVYNSGVKAAFADLKDRFTKEGFVKDHCHQMAHVIGRAAAHLYGDDVSSTYSQGDNFCASGYYHGAMETVVANIGEQNILDEADKICADLRNKENQSLNYRNCTHGLGHGFMGLYQNEVFESLDACDALADEFGRVFCSGGVFMQNIINEDNTESPSKYLDADQPFYPCPEVKTEYKHQCYSKHAGYALEKQNSDFAKVFDLCGKVEEGFPPSCYIGLGDQAASMSTVNPDTEEAQTEYIREQCMQGQDAVAQLTCLAAAARQLIFFYGSDAQAKALCKSLTNADWRATCRQVRKGYMVERQL